MALRQFKAPVQYEAQLAAFESFLKDFKATPEQTITHALGNVTINEDDFDEDDDVMEDDEVAEERRYNSLDVWQTAGNMTRLVFINASGNDAEREGSEDA
ncbi:hypothetical protein BN1723_004271 [Verticillium longisporum]|uniref:Uncharacterized protein n=1 Tax=Verticillium longisporum TaxID=100787 RepID=A0A0G4MSJ9_VERLO|nr:hypothetical protein BN1723_004271 [Verticillium longisporum]